VGGGKLHEEVHPAQSKQKEPERKCAGKSGCITCEARPGANVLGAAGVGAQRRLGTIPRRVKGKERHSEGVLS
jgi:hypothetical protein